MAAISAKLVKELRDKTGAGMMDCKKALLDADGNSELALENLRKSGIAKAEKKASRATNDGRISTKIDGKAGVLVEVLCETDFVSNGPKFIDYVQSIVDKTIAMSEDGYVTEDINVSEKEALTEFIAKSGENMQIKNALRWETSGKLASYIHGKRIGVMVDVEGDIDEDTLHNLCMHIAAFNPENISPDDIADEAIEKEKEIAKAQLVGKPDNIIDKILLGKINKWFTEVCLIKQAWIMDDKTTFEKLCPNAKINRFVRLELGSE